MTTRRFAQDTSVPAGQTQGEIKERKFSTRSPRSA